MNNQKLHLWKGVALMFLGRLEEGDIEFDKLLLLSLKPETEGFVYIFKALSCELSYKYDTALKYYDDVLRLKLPSGVREEVIIKRNVVFKMLER
jgi:hypothetical protein